MKGIITEHKAHPEYVRASPVLAYSEIAEASSPVYSLPDEDRTELLTQGNLTNDSIEDQIIDLTEVDSETVEEPENIIEKVKIAIPKMGLQNEPDILMADDDCSQSILENFPNDITRFNEINVQTDSLQLNVSNNQTGKETNEVNTTAINVPRLPVPENNCSRSVLDNVNENTKYSETRLKRELEMYHYITKNNPVTQPAVVNEIKNMYPMNNTSETQPPKCNIKTTQFDLNKEASIKLAPGTSKAENKKQRRKKNKKEKEIVTQKSQSKVKNRTKRDNKDKPIQRGRKPLNIVLGQKIAHSNISVDKPETAIYNENVQCDLSWVENLRYVREISQENDPTLSIFDDNFWNNFSLPNNWNDKDFEV